MQQMGRSVMRTVKGSVKGYSDTQTKVRNATSNDPWGPSGTEMSEIAALTFNSNDFVEIIEMLDKRLNDKGKNWRHVFKSLTLLDYILHAGSENVVQYFRENIYVVKTLKEFQYIDEFGKDQGANVRQKAKDITNLLLDENKMRASRLNRKDMRDRMSGAGERPRSNTEPNVRRQVPDRSGARSADRDLEAAIAASKQSAAEEAARGRRTNEDSELEEALRLSREEDERRRRELEASSGGNLFDEQQQRQQSNNLIDIDSTPTQQPMATGYASFNPYAAQQQAMYEEQMRQAQLMELQRQQQEQMYMQQQMAQQQMQDQYMRLQQQQYEAQMAYQAQLAQQQQQPIIPQPTAFGTNNPFAAFAPTPSPAPQMPQQTGMPTPERTTSPVQAQQAPAPSRSPIQARPAKDDGKHSDLARMLAAGREDGIDSFGNIGSLRVPVGSQFATKTGNPFLAQQTGQTQQNQQQQHQHQQQSSQQQPFFTI
ncbi:hypothetical protein OIO90_000845 [Microbotryomycetes sp. JL221]|nr:hypothetical protein OIO90_000845 [Microbotryomycetes sp. JL221]